MRGDKQRKKVAEAISFKLKLRDAYDVVMADMRQRGHESRGIAYHAMEHCRHDLAEEIQRLRDVADALEGRS